MTVLSEGLGRAWHRAVVWAIAIGVVVAVAIANVGTSPAIAANLKPEVPVELSSQATAETWNAAPEAAKLTYCTKAYQSFRSAPAQSYIISSNVQAMTPETFCEKLDRFYSFELHEDTTLSEAAGLAPLLFADLDG